MYYICTAFKEKALEIVPWCNGSTGGFGPSSQGSNPCGTTFKKFLLIYQ